MRHQEINFPEKFEPDDVSNDDDDDDDDVNEDVPPSESVSGSSDEPVRKLTTGKAKSPSMADQLASFCVKMKNQLIVNINNMILYYFLLGSYDPKPFHSFLLLFPFASAKSFSSFFHNRCQNCKLFQLRLDGIL